MTTDAGKVAAKLASLNDSLDDLEDNLDSLLAQTLPETLLPLETIQQVKLQVALPYLVYDLVFIYLKTRGIDPKTHPVVAELDRVRQYFGKIKDAEDPEKRKTTVDKAAANRFIKHAIAQVKAQRPPGDDAATSHIRFDKDGNIPQAQAIPVKVTMLAREQYQKELAAAGDEEEDDLVVFDDAEKSGSPEPDVELSKSSRKGKGKAVERDTETKPLSGTKRGRHAVDPFAGYGDDTPAREKKTKKSKVTRR